MGGHYLSALAIMAAATGDAQVQRRLDYVVVELKQAQDANGNGYLGGIPGGGAAWQDVARGTVNADNFSVNGKNGSPGTTCTRWMPACAMRGATTAMSLRAPCWSKCATGRCCCPAT
jgi:hypothetical protein